MTNIKTLKDANTEPVEAVVAQLEHALDLAREGKLRDVCIFGNLIGNQTYSAFDTSDIPLLVGQLALMQHNMLALSREGAVPK
jgi:hypothetical protein